jgi:hypothetical protein
VRGHPRLPIRRRSLVCGPIGLPLRRAFAPRTVGSGCQILAACRRESSGWHPTKAHAPPPHILAVCRREFQVPRSPRAGGQRPLHAWQGSQPKPSRRQAARIPAVRRSATIPASVAWPASQPSAALRQAGIVTTRITRAGAVISHFDPLANPPRVHRFVTILGGPGDGPPFQTAGPGPAGRPSFRAD